MDKFGGFFIGYRFFISPRMNPGACILDAFGQNGENEEAELTSAKSIQALSVEITAMGTDIQACFTRRFRPVTC